MGIDEEIMGEPDPEREGQDAYIADLEADEPEPTYFQASIVFDAAPFATAEDAARAVVKAVRNWEMLAVRVWDPVTDVVTEHIIKNLPPLEGVIKRPAPSSVISEGKP